MAHKRSTAPLNFAHKRSATLVWHLKFIPGWLTKGLRWNSKFYLGLLTKQRPATLEWQLLPLSFNLERLTKGLQRWNGSFLFKISPSGLNFTLRVAHKKGLLRLAIEGLLRCFTGCMTRFPNHLERVLLRKYRPKDPKTRTKDPKTRTKDQRTRGPKDQRTKGPGDQQTRTKGVEEIIFLIGINVLFDRYPSSTGGVGGAGACGHRKGSGGEKLLREVGQGFVEVQKNQFLTQRNEQT